MPLEVCRPRGPWHSVAKRDEGCVPGSGEWVTGAFFGDSSVDQRPLHHDNGHAPLHNAPVEGDDQMSRLVDTSGCES